MNSGNKAVSESIRNFAIIAHIDHGKSTLADRILLSTGVVTEREFREQVLDDMDLERERGITIKASAVTMPLELDGKRYRLNLIDTPGHVDFHYEVSRSLAACEGAILLVDATQGVEAQTVANAHLATEAGLDIVPVINKIDLPSAHAEEVAEEMEHVLAIPAEDVLHVSAKSGAGLEEILRAVVERIRPPEGDAADRLRALIFDSVYDDYRGVVVHTRVFDGRLRAGSRIRMMQRGTVHEVTEVGVFSPRMQKVAELGAGDVGYIVASIKQLKDVKVGDTVTLDGAPAAEALPGYEEAKPMVFCGLYPANNTDYEGLRKAIDKLALNDAAFQYQPETSGALGFGFRCGFLGLLHMEIFQERLERDSGLEVIQTAPNVSYEVLTRAGETLVVESPAQLPENGQIEEFREPVVRTQLIVPAEYIGNIMRLAEERRGKYVRTEYLSEKRVILEYDLPLAEIVYDFYDKLKSCTRGYGTMDYEFRGYFAGRLARLDIMVAGQRVDALATVVHQSVADRRGRGVLKKLRKSIPRHLFQIALQATIGAKIVARENIAPMRKDVTAKCYGGDVSRKRKLLERQKEGKKRMKSIGQVNVPQEAFLAVLGAGEED
jgi:GTP-binding protein LepA